MRQLLPEPRPDLDVDEIATCYAYPSDGAVRGNMVTSLDGAVSADGRSKAISGPPDLFMFGVLRSLADVVVVGAGTARTEGYGPGRARKEYAHLREAANQSVAPAIALVTRSANLNPDSPVFTDALVRTLVITCEAAPPDNRKALSEVADVIVSGDAAVDLPSAFEQLRRRSLTKVLTEGGPHLLGDVSAFGLLDELALSVSPTIAGGDAGRIVQTDAVLLQQMSLKGLLEDSGFLFALYQGATDGKANQ